MSLSIMVQGTGSGVGKSVITAALCRIFLQDGYRVAPFKAQNMALNSFVTYDGGEIGRAQAVQAEACGIMPTVDMNPVLLKPTTDIGAQVIIRGRPVGNFSAKIYTRYKKNITKIVDGSFKRLAKEHEIIVIEGAGSPAEINLKKHDIVNMRMSYVANAPVILVGDIDKGGVFAWFIGTIKLLDRNERRRIKGFIINKFRGDIDLLKGGTKFLEKATGIKVLGVLPYFKNINIPEEDGVFYKGKPYRLNKLRIGVIKLPHISNHTDFDIFKKEDINFSYVDSPLEIQDLDIVILPGTKNTIQDTGFLRQAGFETAIKNHVEKGRILVGICGGFQMLGAKITDHLSVESARKCIKGFGYFDFITVFEPDKVTKQVEAVANVCLGGLGKLRIKGYEIHHGRTIWKTKPRNMFIVKKRGTDKVEVYDGAYTKDFQIWGTHLHGVFDNYNFRKWFLDSARKKIKAQKEKVQKNLDSNKEINKLANLVRKNLDMKYLYKVLNKDV